MRDVQKQKDQNKIHGFSFTPRPRLNSTSAMLSLMVLASGLPSSSASCAKSEKITDRCISFSNGVSDGENSWHYYKNWCICPDEKNIFVKSRLPLTEDDLLEKCNKLDSPRSFKY